MKDKRKTNPQVKIGLTISFVVGLVFGGGAYFLKLAGNFGSISRQPTGFFEYIVYLIILLMVLVPVGYFLYSLLGSKKIGYAIAALIAMAVMTKAFHVMVIIPKQNKERKIRKLAYEQKLQTYKRDYKYIRNHNEFFHVKNDRIVVITAYRSHTITAEPLGVIKNGVLELYEDSSYAGYQNKKKWRLFKDEHGKTIFDNYKCVWKKQDITEYKLEHFQHPPEKMGKK